jgi:hypothetical protein
MTTTNSYPSKDSATPVPFRAYKGERWTVDRGDRKPHGRRRNCVMRT